MKALEKFHLWYDALKEPHRFLVLLAIVSPVLVAPLLPVWYVVPAIAYAAFMMWSRHNFLFVKK